MNSIRYVVIMLNLLLSNALIIHVVNNNINNNNSTNSFNISDIIEKYLKANTSSNGFEASISLSL